VDAKPTLRYSFTAENAEAIPSIAKLLPALASGPDDDPGTLYFADRKIGSTVLRWIGAHRGCELFLRRFRWRYQKRIHMYMNFDAHPLIDGIIAVGRDLR
jgi:hypothetical protein